MTVRNTVFGHIVSKLPHPENTAVEALGYILSSSPSSVSALEDVLRSGGGEVGGISEIRTQETGEDGARPDLVGFDKDGVKRLFIEAKFWAGLTDNQPVGYLKALPRDKPSALLFIAPAKRIETLWVELGRRVAESDELDMVPGTEKETGRSASVGGNRRLMLTSWKVLLDGMASKASVAGDVGAETDIRQLLGLTQRMDAEAFLPIQPEELGPEFPRRMLGLRRIIHAAAKRGRAAGWLSTDGLQAGGNKNGYGQNLRLGGHDHAYGWLGYQFSDWARFRDTPLWLELGPQEFKGGLTLAEVRARLLSQKDPPDVVDRSWRLIVPVPLRVGVEETAVVDSVVALLKRVAKIIDPSIQS